MSLLKLYWFLSWEKVITAMILKDKMKRPCQLLNMLRFYCYIAHLNVYRFVAVSLFLALLFFGFMLFIISYYKRKLQYYHYDRFGKSLSMQCIGLGILEFQI